MQTKKAINEMRMEVPSYSNNEGFLRAATAAFVAQLDPTVDELADIKTAVSEAVTNCIVHAYRQSIGMIYITIRIFSPGTVQIRIRDKGCGIENIAQAMEPLFTTGGEDRAGLGFAVMQSFMDKLKVQSRVGRGTTVVMEKNIRSRQERTKTDG